MTWYLLVLPSEFCAGFALLPVSDKLGLKKRITHKRGREESRILVLFDDSSCAEHQSVDIICEDRIYDARSVQASKFCLRLTPCLGVSQNLYGTSYGGA